MKRLQIISLVLAAMLAGAAAVSAKKAQSPLACKGNGLIHVILDECMHDGEDCPWRHGESPASGQDATCSRSGLNADWMTTAWCDEWSGFGYFECTDGSEIKLQKRTEAEKRRDRGEPD